MRVACRVLSLALISASIALPRHVLASDNGNPTQYVLISFDGAHDLAQWQRSRSLASRTGASFTYFLSCVFLLSRETRKAYRAPRQAAGRSNVGFAQSRDEVLARLDQIRFAVSEGHELASHGCGHFDGKAWSKADWLNEFQAFSDIVAGAYRINGIDPEPDDWKSIVGGVTGFRAPYLSASPALYRALDAAGFAYDASGVSRGVTTPERPGGPARFALPQIPEGPSERRVIAMDYNLYVRHSGGLERPDEAQAFEDRAYQAFLAAFESEHSGRRRPLQIGFHFTLMNDGAYWRALERFASDVCVKPDVACVSYRDYLSRTGTAEPTPAGMGG